MAVLVVPGLGSARPHAWWTPRGSPDVPARARTDDHRRLRAAFGDRRDDGYGTLFVLASLALRAFTFLWFLPGIAYYGECELALVATLPIAPLVTVIHSLGTFVGILEPPEEFRVTRKAGSGR